MLFVYLVQPSNLRPLLFDTIVTALGLVNTKHCDVIQSKHWYTFGYVLGLSDEVLERVEECSEDGRLQSIFGEWLSSLADRATWQAFVEALRSPLLHFLRDTQLAEHIDVWCSWQGTNTYKNHFV